MFCMYKYGKKKNISRSVVTLNEGFQEDTKDLLHC